MTIQYFGYGAVFDVPDLSPFCIKLETFLRMANVPYVKKIGNPRQAPKGKLPYVLLDGEWMGDSHVIVRHLSKDPSHNIDSHLSPEQQAIATAFQGMLEESYYFVLGSFRWLEPKGWKVYQQGVLSVVVGTGVPRFLAKLFVPFVRRGVVKMLQKQGMGRHSSETRAAIGINQLNSLSTYLGDKRFFFGEEPCSLDATIYAMLSSTLDVPIDTPLQQHCLTLTNLCRYCENVKKMYFS